MQNKKKNENGKIDENKLVRQLNDVLLQSDQNASEITLGEKANMIMALLLFRVAKKNQKYSLVVLGVTIALAASVISLVLFLAFSFGFLP